MVIVKAVTLILVSLLVVSCAINEIPRLTEDAIEGRLETGLPEGWGLTGGTPEKYIVSADHEIFQGGEKSISFYSLEATKQDFAAFRQAIETTKYAGKRVRFQAFIRTNRVQQFSGLWMRADSKTSALIAFDNMEDRPIVGTTEWQSYSIVLEIPENAVVLFFGAILQGTGQIWVDECTLDIVDKNTKTTGPFSSSYVKEYSPPSNLLSDPSNLDFEGHVFAR